jgi:hypothetical protein
MAKKKDTWKWAGALALLGLGAAYFFGRKKEAPKVQMLTTLPPGQEPLIGDQCTVKGYLVVVNIWEWAGGATTQEGVYASTYEDALAQFERLSQDLALRTYGGRYAGGFIQREYEDCPPEVVWEAVQPGV